MRIGINTLYYIPGEVGGTETYLKGLLYGLSSIDRKNEYILFTHHKNHDDLNLQASNFTKILCDTTARSRFQRIVFEQLKLPKILEKSNIDILHSPGYIAPLRAQCIQLVTIHDMQYFYYPQYFPKTKLLYWKTFIPLSARKCHVILTVSEHSKADIHKLLKISNSNIFVTHVGSKFSILAFNKTQPDDNILSKHNIKTPYLLSVASLLPHKNLDRLVKSYALLNIPREHQLVLVGLKRNAWSKIKNVLREYKISPEKVILTGYVTDNELLSLYKRASLLILPSLFEGFGIPLIEAMENGCPVAASQKTAIPEILNDAGMLFNPEDPNDIAEKIMAILADESFRQSLIQKGKERASLFTWENVAQKTLKAYEYAYDLNHS